MSVTYTTAAKSARMQAIADLIGTGGKLKIRDSGNVVLATLTFPNPCGTVTNGVLNFDADPDLTVAASASGTAANAIITDSADTTIISGLTVGTSGTEVVLDSVSVTSGQTVTITLGSITHA